jgi:4'-phosphopantetheinyl transferase
MTDSLPNPHGKPSVSTTDSPDFELLWAPPPPQWTLADNAVHVWAALLDQPEALTNKLLDTLSPDEKARMTRFRFQQEQRRFLTGRGLLRRLLALYSHTPPEEIGFTYGIKGKPLLTTPADGPAFNVSHTGRLIVIAVTRQQSVGIDVERLCRLAEMDGIAKNFFTPGEYQKLKESAPGEKRRIFFEIWTRKEAVLKCSGQGLESLASPHEFPTEYARFFKPASGCVGCLCLPAPPSAESFWLHPDTTSTATGFPTPPTRE